MEQVKKIKNIVSATSLAVVAHQILFAFTRLLVEGETSGFITRLIISSLITGIIPMVIAGVWLKSFEVKVGLQNGIAISLSFTLIVAFPSIISGIFIPVPPGYNLISFYIPNFIVALVHFVSGLIAILSSDYLLPKTH